MRPAELLSEYALEFLLEIRICGVYFVRVEVGHLEPCDVIETLKPRTEGHIASRWTEISAQLRGTVVDNADSRVPQLERSQEYSNFGFLECRSYRLYQLCC